MAKAIPDPTITDAIKLIKYGINSKHSAGSMIIIQAIGHTLTTEQKTELLCDTIQNSQRDKRLIKTVNLLIEQGADVNNDMVKNNALMNSIVLKRLLEAGMRYTLAEIEKLFQFCPPKAAVFAEIFKVHPDYRKPLAAQLIKTAFQRKEVASIALVGAELDTDEAVPLIRDALYEQVQYINKMHAGGDQEWRQRYRTERIEELAETLLKLTKAVPKWKAYHKQILDQADSELIAVVAATELEVSS